MNTKITYCKYCGGEINQNKQCTKCGKQYFNIKSPKFLTILLGLAIGIIFYLTNQLHSLQDDYKLLQEERNNAEIAYFKLLDTIDEERLRAAEIICEVGGALILDNGLFYHKFECEKIQEHIEDSSTTISYGSIDECISQGYSKCPLCY